jgi:hypothetical protein
MSTCNSSYRKQQSAESSPVWQGFWRQGQPTEQRSGRGRAWQLRFNKADMAQAPTKGRVLDHTGFDVKDLQAFIKIHEE